MRIKYTQRQPKEYKLFPLKLERSLCDQIDVIAANAQPKKISRQKLIEAILKQVIVNKDFVLNVEE